MMEAFLPWKKSAKNTFNDPENDHTLYKGIAGTGVELSKIEGGASVNIPITEYKMP